MRRLKKRITRLHPRGFVVAVDAAGVIIRGYRARKTIRLSWASIAGYATHDEPLFRKSTEEAGAKFLETIPLAKEGAKDAGNESADGRSDPAIERSGDGDLPRRE